jgi:opacity protein-like surface antigen
LRVKGALAFFAVLMLRLTIAPALAADLPAAAPATPASQTATCTLTICEGFYIGGNLGNTGANFDVIGAGLNGLASNGVVVGGNVGYEFWNGHVFAAIEGDAEYNITSNMPNIASGNSAQYALGAQVKLGYSLAAAFGAATSGQAAPHLPAFLANALISPYVAIGAWDRPWGGVGFATGVGVQALVATNWTLDAEYLHVNYNNAAVNSNVSEQTETLFLLSPNRHF